MKVYAYKSKKSGMFFTFHEMRRLRSRCDGYGVYYDTISYPFTHSFPVFYDHKPEAVGTFHGHQSNEVELVEFNINPS